jgi:hypothetical protein
MYGHLLGCTIFQNNQGGFSKFQALSYTSHARNVDTQMFGATVQNSLALAT